MQECELNAQRFLDAKVTGVDGILNDVTGDLLGLELNVLNVLPVENGDGFAAKVQILRQIALEVAVLVVGIFGLDYRCGGGFAGRSCSGGYIATGGLGLATVAACDGSQHEGQYQNQRDQSCCVFHFFLLT